MATLLFRRLLACAPLLFWTAAVSAQPSDVVADAAPASAGQLRVAVLRATQGEADAGAVDAVDGALLRDLAALAGIEDPTVSPIDYAEIQLTVGCSDEGRTCLSSIAQTMQVDAVLVRKLEVGQERTTIELVYLDTTAADEPMHVRHVVEREADEADLSAFVPELVRELFGIPESVVAAAPEPAAQPDARAPQPGPATSPAEPPARAAERGRVAPLTWVTLAVGAGALGAGAALGLSAQSSFDDYKQMRIEDEDDAARAQDRFEGAQSQGLLATVLVPAGAAVLALGATLLIFDLSESGPSETEIGVAPVPGGALLSLRATAGGP